MLGGSGKPAASHAVTELLARWGQGDLAARDMLIPLVYDELRRVAGRCLAGQRHDLTLQPTALVHEAYLRLTKQDQVSWQNRMHFFAVAARMMRQILVDHARRQAAAKRGGNALTIELTDVAEAGKSAPIDLIALDDALERLAALDSRQSQIVELRFFGGLSIEETSQVVNISPATAKREWATARIWLYRTMSGEPERDA
jgi:RNA polymerase sigma factor (TIGR02999 family)